jgi:hypothetical protein
MKIKLNEVSKLKSLGSSSTKMQRKRGAAAIKAVVITKELLRSARGHILFHDLF